jgi:serine protease AprX
VTRNYPNPFDEETRFTYTVTRPGHVRVEVLDVTGRRVRTLFDGTTAGGEHELAWDGKNASGKPAASGVYLYSVETHDSRASRAMVLQR